MKRIEVHDLTKKFGEFIAVNKISFDVDQGEIFGFLGANGAGKTTAIRMLCGLLDPSSGQVTVAGYDVYTQKDQIKRNIGYMSQKFSLYEDLTVNENIDFFSALYGLSRKEKNLRRDQMFDRLGNKDSKGELVRSLPLGWRQKISFSLALIHQPKIVFLDEPTGGVDPVTRRQFWELINQTAAEGITMFVTTHYMDEAEYCNRLSIMADGCIKVLGKPAEICQLYHVDKVEDVFIKVATERSAE
ncbi:MAG: ABC transporter ATP-binding protein [Bacteroidales bacterium]